MMKLLKASLVLFLYCSLFSGLLLLFYSFVSKDGKFDTIREEQDSRSVLKVPNRRQPLLKAPEEADSSFARGFHGRLECAISNWLANHACVL